MKPDRLSIDLNSPDVAKAYCHWFRTFKNEISAIHILSTCKQKARESVGQFLSELKTLSKDCNFSADNAEQNKFERIHDAFLNGLHSNLIRQHILLSKELDHLSVFDQARSLNVAQQNSNLYSQSTVPIFSNTASIQEIKSSLQKLPTFDDHSAATLKSKTIMLVLLKHDIHVLSALLIKLLVTNVKK